MKRYSAAVALVAAMLLAACGSPESTPTATPTQTEVPIGGVRPAVTRADLDLARERMPGGLLEPCWLPDGFELVHIFYGAPERSTDLYYRGGDRSLHVWQTHRSAAELGSDDPVAMGSPIAIEGNVAWNANDLGPDPGSTVAIIEYSARLPDGRTITVDSDLGPDVMDIVLRSLCSRSATGGSV